MTEKKKKIDCFPIIELMDILTQAYTGWDAPVISFMAAKGAGPFPILISTLLSLRTKDEVTEIAAKRLLEKADSPQAMLNLGEDRIRELIFPVGFYPTKAKRIMEISGILLEKYNGEVPSSMEALLELPGVGRKTANLVLIEGFGIPAICVDTHVHRISNRLGYVRTKTPEETEMALRKKLPHAFWISYNEILVAFGQLICRPISPWCSKCPVSKLCRKAGVEKHR